MFAAPSRAQFMPQQQMPQQMFGGFGQMPQQQQFGGFGGGMMQPQPQRPMFGSGMGNQFGGFGGGMMQQQPMRQPSYGGGGMFGGMQGGFGGMQGGFGGGGFARGMGGMGGMGNPFGQMMGQQGPQMGQFGSQMPQQTAMMAQRAAQQAAGGRKDNQLVGGSDFLPKPPPPRQITPPGMARANMARLQGRGIGGGFQSQGPQNLQMREMQAGMGGRGGMPMPFRRPTQMGIGSMRPPLMAFGQGGFNPQQLARASAQMMGGRGGFFR